MAKKSKVAETDMVWAKKFVGMVLEGNGNNEFLHSTWGGLRFSVYENALRVIGILSDGGGARKEGSIYLGPPLRARMRAAMNGMPVAEKKAIFRAVEDLLIAVSCIPAKGTDGSRMVDEWDGDA